MEANRRVPTRVPGLDAILHGGWFAGGVYMLEGAPGVGKTTLANQIAYLHARAGENTLYVTLLAESHVRMLQHVAGQAFFDPAAVNSSVFYISAYRELDQGGLRAVVELIRGEIARHRTSLLIVDGFVMPGSADPSGDGVRQFVHEVQSLASAMDFVCLLLTGAKSALDPEQTMVDGILVFEDHDHQWRAERRVQVRKFRGSAVERGKHTFCITDQGLQFFPRLEGQARRPSDAAPPAVVPSGIRGLDRAFTSGGLLRGSSTLVRGASGAGKTTFALVFAVGAGEEEPGLAMFCIKSEQALRDSGRASGLPVGDRIERGNLVVRGHVQEDESLDEIGHKILRLVDERMVNRLVIDGLADLADTAAFASRGYRFLGRLLGELKARGVTSLFTADPPALDAAAGQPVAESMVGLFDNAFELGHDDGPGGGYRILIRKVRGTRLAHARFALGLDEAGLHATALP